MNNKEKFRAVFSGSKMSETKSAKILYGYPHYHPNINLLILFHKKVRHVEF